VCVFSSKQWHRPLTQIKISMSLDEEELVPVVDKEKLVNLVAT